MRTVSFGIAALALGFAFKSGGTFAAASADVGLHGGPTVSVFGTIHPDIFRLRTPIGAQIPENPGVRLASLDTDVASWAALDDETGSLTAASFDDRFGTYANQPARLASFDERFGPGTGEPRNPVLRRAEPAPKPASQGMRLASAQPDVKIVSLPTLLPQPRPASAPPTNRFRPADKQASLPKDGDSKPDAAPGPEDDGKTAIYDITAKTVYLPDGRRLEAHSGLGSRMDDPRYVNVRMEGATPPNVYNLTLRESLFHGVRALRMTPAGTGKMYGRAGILAHSYMLGPNGQSNGCVSFTDYTAFLNAYLNGEVKRIAVVEHLDAIPPSKTQFASASWLPDAVKKFFQPSPQYAEAQPSQ